MMKHTLQTLGKLEPFEIRNSSITFCLGAPSTFLYFEIMQYYHTNLVLPFYGNIIFSVLFFCVGVLPNFRNKWILQHYGLLVFFSTMAFQHYLNYATYLNNFSLDFLLVTYVFVFGSVLLLSNRILVIIYSAIQALHLTYYVYISDLSLVYESSILSTIGIIFLLSFLITTGFIRRRKKLEFINSDLETIVQQRTSDIELRTKELYQKNKDLEEFAYVVSHDLKRPLRNMYTLTDWLIEDEEQFNTTARESLARIKKQITQMDLLVEGILNYSLQGDSQQEKREVNVHTLVKKVIRMYEAKHITFTIAKRLPRMIGNEAQLSQLFQNLIQNAIKHNDKQHIEITIDYQETKTAHRFYVKDNGPGIAERYHKKVFELFQKLQVNTDGEAIGIGLALVKKIVERNEGKVYLKSTEGKGAIFGFQLPKKAKN